MHHSLRARNRRGDVWRSRRLAQRQRFQRCLLAFVTELVEHRRPRAGDNEIAARCHIFVEQIGVLIHNRAERGGNNCLIAGELGSIRSSDDVEWDMIIRQPFDDPPVLGEVGASIDAVLLLA